MINDDGVVITTDFQDGLEHVFGKLVVAPTVEAQQRWELWRKNPTMFTLAPGYLVKKEKDGVILEAELVELSIIPKVNEKK